MGKAADVEANTRDQIPGVQLISITPELLAQQTAGSKADLLAEIETLAAPNPVYRLGPGDIINIMVWDHPELALIPAASSRNMGSVTQADIGNGYPISADGTIQFPYAGVVDAAGLTELELRDLLMKKLAVYINDPQLTVRVQSYRNSRVYIDGEVNNPGLAVMDDIPMTLPEALNRAGGYTKEADRSSVMLSRNGVTMRLDLPELTRLGINPSRIMLANGDMLRVLNQRETQVFVLGEVTEPKATPMYDGRLNLTQALGEAGGVSMTTSNPSQVYILRRTEGQEPQIYHLNANSPAAYLLANDFQMQARDVVFVDPAAVVRWQRVIGNLLPSLSGVVSTGNVLK
ncbi:polysaccharide biosynthesis/export family protein [Alcaligenes endophyticus]|uniref:Polysaccharide biosynthesis/export family protein n=1 Tax=Alcaligenes endophyticus TaxID=1929088 RepID=A0ABT8EFS3_9BURK|nr:polysaccharide biosynthesis/export family protein [Alcaligenes endophyticus]MCX5590201.1 polysaccharide biosynthesis/export family protein [Alcaligenes endophyticus]MDN4120136.1 polysaccharide biosynthesis/export family protein [Alcaligenes endophyticus]